MRGGCAASRPLGSPRLSPTPRGGCCQPGGTGRQPLAAGTCCSASLNDELGSPGPPINSTTPARQAALPEECHSSGPGVFPPQPLPVVTEPMGAWKFGGGAWHWVQGARLPWGRQAARPRRAHRAARLPPGLRPGGQQVTGKRDPAWTEMKGGLAAADTRRHLPRRAGGPAAGMSLSPRAAPRPCRASSSLPAGEPPAPHAPAQSPRGLLTERGQGPDLRPSRPPAPCQQIPCALTHPRVLTACSGLTHMLSLRPPAQGICSFFPSRCLCQVVPTLLLCCQRGTQPAVCLSIHPQQCAPPCHPSAKPEDAWGTEGPRGGHGHWPCCHQEEVTKLVQESLPSASWGPHMLFKAGRGEIACHQPPCRLATSLPGCQ